MRQGIMVWDPLGKVAEGTIVEGPHLQAVLARSGAAVLPVDVDLLERHALAGYHRRAWGAGVLFDNMRGVRGCPMVLYVHPERRFIHWTARVERLGDELQGTMRLTGNTGQPSAMSGGLGQGGTPIELAQLGPPDRHGGWTLAGSSQVSCTGEGYFGLSLYGSARGCRVLWSAVSQASDPR